MSFPSQFVLNAPNQLYFKPNNGSLCGPESDIWWGPSSECRTILRRFLEQWVLSQSGPAIILLIVALPRIPYLWKQNEKTRLNPMRTAKLVSHDGDILNYLAQMLSGRCHHTLAVTISLVGLMGLLDSKLIEIDSGCNCTSGIEIVHTLGRANLVIP